jgi:multiple sugar transport system ATP-binding protein
MGDALNIRNLSKRFGRGDAGVVALRDVSLHVGADELLVVLGDTGAGKTTLLRTIAGLEVPDSGTIHIGGDDATDWPPARRDVALVFQNFSIYPNKSVRENLSFPLRAPGRKLAEADIKSRIATAAEMLRIAELLDKPSHRLSGGQMQRVAIGRAIVRQPRLFLMDEPLTNLDAKLRESLRVELVMLRRRLKTPMVFVTHDQAEAMSMGDRIAVLGGGWVLQIGTPAEVYRAPVSPGVARLLGRPRINLVGVTRTGDFWCRSGAKLIPVDGAHESTGVSATLGVRPEHLILHGGGVSGQVRAIEDGGAMRVAVIDWLGQTWHALSDHEVAAGDEVWPRVAEGLIWRESV